jgi:predicted RNase H-like HicB family nuclease
MQRFTVVLTAEPDGSAYNVIVPALPGCFTWGAPVEESLERAREAIALFLEDADEGALPETFQRDAIVTTVAIDSPAHS